MGPLLFSPKPIYTKANSPPPKKSGDRCPLDEILENVTCPYASK